ncbi:MAG: hypothetical protein GY851_32325, partial [bacterium]|nr:hypothetical protein [bacterium]
KVGAFSRGGVNDSTRQVYTILRAARVYAATFREDTAVFYTETWPEDSDTGLPTDVAVMDGLGVARRLPETHDLYENIQADLASLSADVSIPSEEIDDALDNVFFMVQAPEVQIQPLSEGACARVFLSETMYTAHLNYVCLYDLRGWVPEDLADVPPLIEPRENPYAPGAPRITFPAHVFRPSGMLDGAYGDSGRTLLWVGAAPDAPLEDRYFENEGTDYETLSIVELHPATGRVKISEDIKVREFSP